MDSIQAICLSRTQPLLCFSRARAADPSQAYRYPGQGFSLPWLLLRFVSESHSPAESYMDRFLEAGSRGTAPGGGLGVSSKLLSPLPPQAACRMKACGDHSGILSPKNATSPRLSSEEPDVVSIPKAAEVCQFVTLFVTFFRRAYGKMLLCKAKQNIYMFGNGVLCM